MAFFIVQLSHLYMTTGKSIVLTKVMSLLCNMLSRFVIAFLPMEKNVLISWLQSPSTVILEPRKTVCQFFHCFSIYLHEVMGVDALILIFWMLSFEPTVRSFRIRPHDQLSPFYNRLLLVISRAEPLLVYLRSSCLWNLLDIGSFLTLGSKSVGSSRTSSWV